MSNLEGLQRLTQIVTGGGEKAALALIGPVGESRAPDRRARAALLSRGLIGKFPRRLGGLARHDEFRLDPLAIGHIANGGGDESPAHVLDGAQTDLDGKLGTVATPAEQFKPRAHGPHAHVADIVLAMSDVPGAETLRHQHLDALADDFVVLVPEQGGDLPIGKPDDAGGIDDDHRIRGGIERAAGEIRRGCTHYSRPLSLTLGVNSEHHYVAAS